MKRIFFALLTAFGLLIGLGHIYYNLTGDFREGVLLKGKDSDDSLISDGLKGQKFTYLGHGNQAYAFVSQDGTFVLKLFKGNIFKNSTFLKLLPTVPPFSYWTAYHGSQKNRCVNRLIEGYSIAWSDLSVESSLKCFHLGSKEPLYVHVTDGVGVSREIDLSQYIFAIQDKVQPTRDVLNSYLRNHDLSLSKEAISQLLAMYQVEFEKGIFDHDRNIIDNTGFVQGRAVRHDVGRLMRNKALTQRSAQRKELSRVINSRLSPWLKRWWPKYHDELIGHAHDVVDAWIKTTEITENTEDKTV